MRKRLALYTFIDAFGWEIYQHYGFLENIIIDSRKLRTTFGFSSAADPSILTGRYPDEHTHWSSFYYSPETSPFKLLQYLSFLPRSIFDRGRVRHWISKILVKFYGYTGYFEIYSMPFKHIKYFDYLEKRDYFVPGGIPKTDTIFDYCVENNIPYFCSNWRLPEEKNLEIAKQKIKEGKIEFVYLYLPRLDGVMHAFGTRNPKVEEKIRSLENELSEVLETANQVYDDVSFYVFSDHGMTDVSGTVEIISKIENTDLIFGKDYVAMYDSTMARFWFLKEGARKIIEKELKKIEQGYIIPDEELKKMHVYFSDHKFGDLFFLMKPGILIVPSFMGLKALPGMHGYHPKDENSFAFIGSNKKIPKNINSITDIRKTMENELTYGK